MKKNIFTYAGAIVLLSTAFGVFASNDAIQNASPMAVGGAKATITFNNYDSDKPIFYLNTGTKASGSDVFVELWAGATAETLAPVSNTLGNSKISLDSPGSFDAGIGIIPNAPAGGTAYFQLRAWKGAASYDAAKERGETVVFSQTTGNWNPSAVPPTPATGPSLNIPSSIIIEKATFRLTTVASPATGGSVIATPGPGASGKYSEGTSVTVNATPNPGYKFSHWSGDAPSPNSVVTWTMQNPLNNYTMSQDKTLTANFISLIQISTQPQSQTVEFGKTAVFTVKVTGVTAVSYQWRLNGAALTERPTVKGVNTDTLTLSPVTRQDAGQYDVVVSVGADSVTSEKATLAVVTPAQLKISRKLTGKLAFGITGNPNKSFIIQGSSDLKNWVPYQTNKSDNAGSVEVEISADSALKFFRTVEQSGPVQVTKLATIGLNNYDSNTPLFYQNLGTLLPLGYSIQLLGGPLGGDLMPVYLASILKTTVFSLTEPGFFDGGICVVPGVEGGTQAQFQLQVWKGGTSYDSATSKAQSSVFQQSTGTWDDKAVPPVPATGPSLNLQDAVIIKN